MTAKRKLTEEARSLMMSRVSKTNSRPERLVRRLVHGLGCRFALHRRDLPGTPDIVLPARRSIILVHGCFWHQHEGCKHATRPTRNVGYWAPKLARNVERDRRVAGALQAAGWNVIIVWECELREPDALKQRLAASLGCR